MKKRFIYICSPLRGDMEQNQIKAREYCREAVTCYPDVVPIAPHIYCTQFLDDLNPDERAVGLEMGLALLDLCDEVWVYGLENPSEGMKMEIKYAEEKGIPVYSAPDMIKATDQPANSEELGDVIIKFPSHVEKFNGAAAIDTTTLRLNGNMVEELAKQLKRYRGKDVEVEV